MKYIYTAMSSGLSDICILALVQDQCLCHTVPVLVQSHKDTHLCTCSGTHTVCFVSSWSSVFKYF